MSQLLLEIFSEEIPARMQSRAAADLERLLTEKLKGAGLAYESARTLVGPRRLTAVIEGLPARSPDVREERKGPRVDAPKPALDGFLRGAGVATLEQCETRQDKKGDYYVAVIEKPGRAAADIVAQAVPEIMRDFPWPKSMRLPRPTSRGADFHWVRPVHRILCVLDGEVVPFEVGGVKSGDLTEGHRLLGRGPFRVRNFDEYKRVLEGEGRVMLGAAERRLVIFKEAERLCQAQGLELVEDAGLLDEVAGLAEHPVVLLGDMDPSFLDLPPEVIRLTMRTHQKYFAVRRADGAKRYPPATSDAGRPSSEGAGGYRPSASIRPTEELAPHFIVVANQEAPDGGKAIAAGNARVLSARLNDARYFWDHDRGIRLEDFAAKLSGIVFHQKLGSVAEKVERVAALARELAPVVGADPDLAERAARLAKADLVSEMVGEFPELQGVMGRYYALQQGEPRAVADAIRDHYKPQGPSDSVPSEPVSVALALADKLDTLVAFWAIEEKPTGSKDPYALRRAALGVVRIILQNGLRLNLVRGTHYPIAIGRAVYTIQRLATDQKLESVKPVLPAVVGKLGADALADALTNWVEPGKAAEAYVTRLSDMPSFFADRLKVHLRDEGHRHDLVDAVFALGEDDLVLIVKRVEALGRFLDMDDGKQLLAAYRRAANILRDEEKKDGRRYEGEPVETLLVETEEIALHAALIAAQPKVRAALEREDFETAMAALAPIRPAIDAFFDQVMVNAEDQTLRRNRLVLLACFRDALSGVADFTKISG